MVENNIEVRICVVISQLHFTDTFLRSDPASKKSGTRTLALIWRYRVTRCIWTAGSRCAHDGARFRGGTPLCSTSMDRRGTIAGWRLAVVRIGTAHDESCASGQDSEALVWISLVRERVERLGPRTSTSSGAAIVITTLKPLSFAF